MSLLKLDFKNRQEMIVNLRNIRYKLNKEEQHLITKANLKYYFINSIAAMTVVSTLFYLFQLGKRDYVQFSRVYWKYMALNFLSIVIIHLYSEQKFFKDLKYILKIHCN